MPALNLQNANAERCLRVQAALQRRARTAHRAMSTEEQEIFDAAERRLEELRSTNPRNMVTHPRNTIAHKDADESPDERAYDSLAQEEVFERFTEARTALQVERRIADFEARIAAMQADDAEHRASRR